MTTPILFRHSLIVIIIGLAAVSCTSNNWPQFRGADNNMVVNSQNLPTEWGNDLNIKWKVPLQGKGWSNPIIWGDKIFMTEAILEPLQILRPAKLVFGKATCFQNMHLLWHGVR